ncbi:MAG: AraC family transcriptional regulator N-terminal domain-containing protein [Bacteroidota bacterium]
MNIFETHQVAERVWLNFDQPVLASMIKGKKVMHLGEKDPFPFLPGESLMLPREEWMNIDFPEANLTNPTQCLAMTISEEKMLLKPQAIHTSPTLTRGSFSNLAASLRRSSLMKSIGERPSSFLKTRKK